MELTILMPCLNEAETIAECVKKATAFLKSQSIEGEVLISDNGSTDGSQAIARDCGARVIQVPRRGYGAALIGGIAEAKGKYVIMGDADASYDFSNLMPFVEKLRQGHELIMGNRFKGGIKPGAMPFLNKYLGNPVLSFIGRLFFKINIGDFHCGLRGFNKAAIQSLKLETEGMEFASEMVVKSALKPLKTAEVPIVLAPDGRSRPPHLRKWRDGWRHLRFLLLACPRWLFLYPGCVMALLGALLMLILGFGPLEIGSVTFDIHTLLLSSACLMIGLQCVFFSFCCDILNQDRSSSWIKRVTLEKGIVAGLCFIVLGVAGFAWALSIWQQAQFGLLQPSQVMRITIPAVTSLMIGTQMIFASFFASLLIGRQH